MAEVEDERAVPERLADPCDRRVELRAPGRDPRGARADLGGREAIVMETHGPWDHEGLLLRRVERSDLYDAWQVLGPDGPIDPRTLEDRIAVTGEVQLSFRSDSFAVLPAFQPLVAPYELRVSVPGERDLVASGTVRRSQWNVTVFPWEADPIEDEEGWRADADRFGVLGSTELQMPAGRWRLRTVSDDGIRVRLDDEVVIEDWSIHAPREQTHEFTVENERMMRLDVAYFENTGSAWLDVDLEWVGPLDDGDRPAEGP